MPAPPPRPAHSEFASAGPPPPPVPFCLKLRHIVISELAEDGTLGLFMNGTSIVGFSSPSATDVGWFVGDQIVEVNGSRVANFHEFLDLFRQAQSLGFPILFTVLRREQQHEVIEETAEGAIENLFNEHSFTEIAGQLQDTFKSQRPIPGPLQRGEYKPYDPIFDNPYVQALRQRRSDLMRSSAGWWKQDESDELGSSLAARMATERSDALSTLVPPSKEPKSGPKPWTAMFSPLSTWFYCSPHIAEESCNCRTSGAPNTPRQEGDKYQVSVYPLTPRVDGELHPAEWPQWMHGSNSSESTGFVDSNLSSLCGEAVDHSALDMRVFGSGEQGFHDSGAVAVMFTEQDGGPEGPGIHLPEEASSVQPAARLGGPSATSQQPTWRSCNSKRKPVQPNDNQLPEWPYKSAI